MGGCSSNESKGAASSKPCLLEDGVTCVSPYFKVHKPAEFKAIWKAAFDPFAHKEDAAYYAFCFNAEHEDGVLRAHCREAYTSAETVLQHLADVDGPLKAVLADGIAELERLEARGPAAEIAKLREPLGAFGCEFLTAEWGFRPTRPPQPVDTVVHLYPYFTLKDAAKFKQIWKDAYPATKAAADAERSHQYAFCFSDGDKVALCREAYADAESTLLHIKNVGGPLGEVLDPANGIAELLRLEIHAPADQMPALKEGTAGMGAQFFVTEWGFRN